MHCSWATAVDSQLGQMLDNFLVHGPPRPAGAAAARTQLERATCHHHCAAPRFPSLMAHNLRLGHYAFVLDMSHSGNGETEMAYLQSMAL